MLYNNCITVSLSEKWHFINITRGGQYTSKLIRTVVPANKIVQVKYPLISRVEPKMPRLIKWDNKVYFQS
jgi:hypothetical protein